jgi:CheY-like chemotaxis protein
MSGENKKTILLVEDEIIIAMLETQQLEEKGYIVHHVNNGEVAVKTILEEDFPIDLILMDIDLGSGIDGIQVAEQILSYKDIPIVFLSSHTEPEVVEKTEKITSYGFIIKNSGIVVLDTSIKMAFKLFEAIIKHKRAEEKVLLSEENYRFVFLNMNSYNSLYEV